MEKHYQKIAKSLKIPSNGVHLVHYVLHNMRESCVFPPAPDETECFFSPLNICSAVVAYLKEKHRDDPWGTMENFGFESSSQIGAAVLAIQANRNTRLDVKISAKASEFEGLFSKESVDLRPVRWIDEIEDSYPHYDETHHLLRRHFGGRPVEELVISRRRFPVHVRADIQLALDQLFADKENVQLLGINPMHLHEGIDFRALTIARDHYATKVGPLTYSEVTIGSGKSVSCLSSGLWLWSFAGAPVAAVLGSGPGYSDDGRIQIELATLNTEDSKQYADDFFDQLQRFVEDSKCYRGKILSFEHTEDYEGRASELKVHELKNVRREQVILPPETLELLDRNIVDFVQQRPALKKRGMNLKKGLLLFGPPGTGKTHTVHYLSRALPDTTTLIITSEQIGWLSRYMTLARLLQPSLVVIEDADLIARERENMDTCEEVLLNKLLNEMDGLRADAEIIFLLTTNRPEALEAALTARPGRIDQAIEFPLPNEDGRRQLAGLYAGNQDLASEVVEAIVAKTEQTSAAFIKELMRRATQYAIARGFDEPISKSDVETAVEEMLFSGGAFNRRILGGNSSESQFGFGT